MIKVNNLTKKIGKKTILENISLEINSGDIIGIVGENGSGKSTLVKTLLGLIKASSGNIIYNSKNFNYFPDVSNMAINMKPIELVSHFCEVNGIKSNEYKEKIKEFSKKLDLENKMTNNMKTLSTGEKKRIYMMIILLIKKEVVFFDEPTDNLDDAYNNIFFDILQQLSKKGVTIVVISHSFEFLEKFINKLIILKNGKLVYNDFYLKNQSIQKISEKIHSPTSNFKASEVIDW
ncbi:ATP-binding cassette domain-containing protein [Spiroplasma tabanidicola]|uniref:ABC transporter ATP-binding protein n=1 Tax=Spiroplasma tabanidicola TaxID=324079 RepID=A0A6I6CA18_9MOLU|nr:ABC transporter ATP-binding protein [Spiroplasma tabanidicola]QGS52299.1 ABC transporter ATP-binding protein [Spiroplasma tabanidicola]